jgi:pyruvate/2-oxoglutarate dehydrogenase complex dihydrolipoamide dehydrogenase (E3) component
VIGLEMGSVWRRLGTQVTVVEFADSITPGIDKETVKNFHKIMKKQGMKFKMSTKVRISVKKGSIKYHQRFPSPHYVLITFFTPFLHHATSTYIHN